MFISWKMFLSVVTQSEGISIQAKDLTFSSLLLLPLTILHQLLGRSLVSMVLVYCLKEHGVELELTGVSKRLQD